MKINNRKNCRRHVDAQVIRLEQVYNVTLTKQDIKWCMDLWAEYNYQLSTFDEHVANVIGIHFCRNEI